MRWEKDWLLKKDFFMQPKYWGSTGWEGEWHHYMQQGHQNKISPRDTKSWLKDLNLLNTIIHLHVYYVLTICQKL